MSSSGEFCLLRISLCLSVAHTKKKSIELSKIQAQFHNYNAFIQKAYFNISIQV